MCNNTWHNRRIEGILLSVSRDFARRSLAALIGNKTTASTALAFLQTNTDCVKHSRQLRHHLNIQVLMWLCCPLEWWYESDSEAEEERIQHPVLRTLQETPFPHERSKQCAFHAQYLTDHGHCCMRYAHTSDGLGHLTSATATRVESMHGTCLDGLTTHGYGMKQQKNGFLSEIHLQNGNATSSTTNKDNRFIGGSLANAGFLNQ